MAGKQYFQNLRRSGAREKQIALIGEYIDSSRFSEIIDFSLRITVLFCRATEKFSILKNLLLGFK